MMTKQAELKKQAYASTLKSRALSVLIYLIDRSNKELTCFPAIPTIAEQLHISVSTVKRALHELEDSGYIIRDFRFRENNRGQTSNLYTLVLFESQPTPGGRDGLQPEEYGEHAGAEVETMEVVGTMEAPQEIWPSRKKCHVEHISFGMIRAQKEETRERREKKTLHKFDDNECRKETTECLWARASCFFGQNTMYCTPGQDTGQFSSMESGVATTPVYPWTGAGFSLAPP